MSLWITSKMASIGLSTILAHTPIAYQDVSRSLIIGEGSGLSLTVGKCNIIIGDHIDVPSPRTSYYLNIDGVEYPASARHDPVFQKLVKRRADELARKLLGKGYEINVEPFFKDCDPVTLSAAIRF